MKNFIKIGVLACAISSFALAEGAFIGAEGGYVFKSKISSGEESVKDSVPSIGIKGGYAWDEARAYVQYNHVFEAKKIFVDDDGSSETGKWSNNEFLVGADWTPAINDSVKFVLGGYSGVSVLNVKADDGKDNFKGWLIGAKAGAIVSISDNLEFEGGLKADKTFGYKVEDGIKLKQTKYGAYAGVNFKF